MLDFNAGSVMTNLGNSLPGFYSLLLTITAVAGVWLSISSIIGLIKSGRSDQKSKGIHILGVVVGAGMLATQGLLAVSSYTIFQTTDYPTILTQFNAPTDADQQTLILYGVVAYINFIGWALVSRATWKLWDGAKYQDRGYVRKSLTMFCIAAACTNFALFVDVMANTIGAQPIGHEYFDFTYN